MTLKKISRILIITSLMIFIGLTPAMADKYPSKPITLIIPLGAGGSHDLNARVFTSVIPQYLGQAVVVKLMPGAGGQTGTAAAVKAKPDMVIDTAAPHGMQRLFDHVQRGAVAGPFPIAQQEQQVVGRGEFRRA